MSMQEYFLLSLFEFYFYCQGGRGLVGGEAGASAPCTVSSDGAAADRCQERQDQDGDRSLAHRGVHNPLWELGFQADRHERQEAA